MMNINWCGSEENDGIDRISSLLDDARAHILSLLSTREAVQTCILSKRWINIWAMVSDLKFDIQEFVLLEELENLDEDMVVEFVTKCELLVKDVLEKRETSFVNRFQLWLDFNNFCWPSTQVVADYIVDVMKLKPRECSVKLCLCETLNLQTDLIFTSASLIYLELCLSTVAVVEPNSVNLPCLKTLKGVEISSNSLKNLLSGCHVLEELVLDRCYINFIEICSNTLKKLILLNFDYYDMKLHISTPNLLYFNINYFRTRDTLFLNMPSLVHATIFLSGWYDQDEYVTMEPKLIHSLSNVESLQLKFVHSYPIGKIQRKDFSNYSVFDNLKSLELLVGCKVYIFDHLAIFFIYQSPKLQELTFKNDNLIYDAIATEFVDAEITQEGPRDALVQRKFLNTVRILDFKNEKEFVDQLINKLLVHVKIIYDSLGEFSFMTEMY